MFEILEKQIRKVIQTRIPWILVEFRKQGKVLETGVLEKGQNLTIREFCIFLFSTIIIIASLYRILCLENV
jgi:hypothetical protein